MNKIGFLFFLSAVLIVIYVFFRETKSLDSVHKKAVEKVINLPKESTKKISKTMIPKPLPKNNRKTSLPIKPLLSSKDLAKKEPKNTEKVKPERPNEIVYSTSKEGIESAMKIFLPNMRKCYDQVRAEYPDIEGRIVLSFQISKNDDPENIDIAKIEEVEILETELDYEEMDNCVMDTIDNLWFEPPEDGKIFVRYPFVFSY